MAMNWKDYQEETATFFRNLGLDAETDVTLRGIRTNHDIDVLVRSHHVGFNVTWLVECKHWQTRVCKLHVLALREIVTETGSDRGILLSEQGFQSGAIEAATLTNVHTTSLAALEQSASKEIFAMRLRELYDRTVECKRRYWDIPKAERIRLGLRPDFGLSNYSGNIAVQCAEELLAKAFRDMYPFECDGIGSLMASMDGKKFYSPRDVIDIIEPLIRKLEKLLPEERAEPS